MTGLDRTWRIGDLARATGLTVRALHHYDRLGLLSPASRTDGGHRCYTPEDVRRLHRIVALRSLGIPLNEIGLLLAGQDDAAGLLRRQLGLVDERIRQAVTLRARLLSVLRSLDRNAGAPAQELLALTEETVAMNEPLTPERLAELTRERERYASELSHAQFEALRQNMKRAWDSLGASEQDRLVTQRRSALAAMTGEDPSAGR
jgi:MerR family transcriptional regulator, thiopeptide resistance regulator